MARVSIGPIVTRCTSSIQKRRFSFYSYVSFCISYLFSIYSELTIVSVIFKTVLKLFTRTTECGVEGNRLMGPRQLFEIYVADKFVTYTEER